MSIEDQNEFKSDLRIVEAEVQTGVNEDYANQKDCHWIIWETYCAKTHLCPFLLNIKDPVPYLKIFGQQLRNGRLTPSSRQIRSATVSDYLTLVGQRFANMGSNDPRLNKYGKLDFCLSRQKRSWKKHDKPSVCVKPMPISIIMAALIHVVVLSPSMERESSTNMICIAFFYCMRPGKYTGTMTND